MIAKILGEEGEGGGGYDRSDIKDWEYRCPCCHSINVRYGRRRRTVYERGKRIVCDKCGRSFWA